MQRTLSVEQSKADSAMRLSRQWPGERHPTRWDVHDANESPAITFLDRFRAALLHSEGAEEDALLDSDSVIDSSENMTTVSQTKPHIGSWPIWLNSSLAGPDQIVYISNGVVVGRCNNSVRRRTSTATSIIFHFVQTAHLPQRRRCRGFAFKLAASLPPACTCVSVVGNFSLDGHGWSCSCKRRFSSGCLGWIVHCRREFMVSHARGRQPGSSAPRSSSCGRTSLSPLLIVSLAKRDSSLSVLQCLLDIDSFCFSFRRHC